MREPKKDEYIVQYGSMKVLIHRPTGRVIEREGNHPHPPDIKNYRKTEEGWVPKRPG